MIEVFAMSRTMKGFGCRSRQLEDGWSWYMERDLDKLGAAMMHVEPMKCKLKAIDVVLHLTCFTLSYFAKKVVYDR